MYKTSASVLQKVAELIYDKSGICFPENHLRVLDQRIQKYINDNSLTENDLYTKLLLNQDALYEFVGFVTTNHTHFFRSMEQFNVLGDKIIPELLGANKNTKHLYIWSAACSTGEEPYTLALYLHHFFETNSNYSDITFSILATDIDTVSLSTAEKGEYPLTALQYIPNIYHQYLNIESDKQIAGAGCIKIPAFLKGVISFKFHNLMQANNRINYDIIFCRNVLIYFDIETQEKVVRQLTSTLNKERYLFVSPSESLTGLRTNLSPVILPKVIYYTNK